MRWTPPLLLLVAALAACAKTLPPDDPSNVDDTSQATKAKDEPPPPDHTPLGQADPTVAVTVKDDTGDKKAMSCGGANIPDLAAVLAQASCEVPSGKADEAEKDLKDQLEIKVETESPKVSPGASTKVTVTFHNKGKTVLPLDFVVDPEPRFDFEVYTLKGSRVDKPAGDSPPLPPEVQNATTGPDKTVARVTLAPNGTATVTESWTAVKYKWASKDKAKGALPGRGYPREPAGPIGKGKYVLRVITPLVGVYDGADHELTQPRTQVEIGSL
jgi:hypothetical protein